MSAVIEGTWCLPPPIQIADVGLARGHSLFPYTHPDRPCRTVAALPFGTLACSTVSLSNIQAALGDWDTVLSFDRSHPVPDANHVHIAGKGRRRGTRVRHRAGSMAV